MIRAVVPELAGSADRSTELPTAEPAAVPRKGGSASVPRHVAVIMDGNGRWARARGLPRIAGHRAGAQAVRRCIEGAISSGIEWLTLYAFSSENWRRPQSEVSDLTSLMRQYLRSELAELGANGVCFRVIGDRERFSPELRTELDRAERQTAGNRRLNLTVALSYGGRAEILVAARKMARAAQAGEVDIQTADEASFGRFLSTAGMPDPDLLIRTSGEQRLSNFLLWQCAYAELLFLDVLWPDFGPADLSDALAEYARRERRYGASGA
jgi:undecaprenyl diphosphate synthase